MGLLGKLFGGNKRNEQLASWAKTVPISESQRTAMEELWYDGKEKRPPGIDPLKEPSEDDVEYILKICSADFRPTEFGSADSLRLATFRHFKDLGFSPEQSAVIAGMMFNMVGRPDL